jgi:hypothetical protein
MNLEEIIKLEEASKRAVERAMKRLKEIDNTNHPSLKKLDEIFKGIK